MENEQRRAAKGQMIALMQGGHPWQEAAAMAGVQVCRSTADQLYRELSHRQDTDSHDGLLMCTAFVAIQYARAR